MADFVAMKQMIDDLSFRRSELQKHVNEFQRLERELDNLKQRAHTDPIAQQKLNKVAAVMDADFLQKREALIGQVNDLTSNIQTMTQLVKYIPVSDKPVTQFSSTPVRRVRTTHCNFV